MNIRRALIAWLLLIPLSLPAQNRGFPEDGFISGWNREGPVKHFSPATLFNHINGGAELFLEFGFEELLVQNYKSGPHEIGIQVYRMRDSEAAFGIYLLKRGMETPLEAIPARNSSDMMQFTIVKNDHFILIDNFQGNKDLVPVMVELARVVLEPIAADDPLILPESLPRPGMRQESLLLFRGPFALQPLFTFGEGDILQLRGRITGFAVEYTEPAVPCTLLFIPYPEISAARDALTHLRAHLDPYLKILSSSENGFTFKDYRGRYGSVLMERNELRLKINLHSPEN